MLERNCLVWENSNAAWHVLAKPSSRAGTLPRGFAETWSHGTSEVKYSSGGCTV